MSRCNYCTLRDIQKVAANAQGEVVLKPRPFSYAPEGVDVFIRYPKYDFASTAAVIVSEELVWAAWFMKLPDYCVC